MKKLELAAAVALLMLGSAVPAFADGDEPLEKVVGGMEWVPRMAGVGAGVVGGTPIAAVRQTYKAYTSWTPDLADKIPGGKDSGLACGFVSLVTLPAAVVWGGVTGPYYGTKNGVVHGFNEPFTHQSFCLAADYDESK